MADNKNRKHPIHVKSFVDAKALGLIKTNGAVDLTMAPKEKIHDIVALTADELKTI